MENLILTESSIFYLGIIRKWAKFISIVMFVMIGLMAMAGFFAGFAMNAISSMAVQSAMPFPGIFFTVIYILMAIIYFFPVLYLYRFSQRLGNALVMGSSEELSNSFHFLKKHYHFIGVMMIIFLVFMALVFIITIIAAMFGLMAPSGGNEFF